MLLSEYLKQASAYGGRIVRKGPGKYEVKETKTKKYPLPDADIKKLIIKHVSKTITDKFPIGLGNATVVEGIDFITLMMRDIFVASPTPALDRLADISEGVEAYSYADYLYQVETSLYRPLKKALGEKAPSWKEFYARNNMGSIEEGWEGNVPSVAIIKKLDPDVARYLTATLYVGYYPDTEFEDEAEQLPLFPKTYAVGFSRDKGMSWYFPGMLFDTVKKKLHYSAYDLKELSKVLVDPDNEHFHRQQLPPGSTTFKLKLIPGEKPKVIA